jgi:hypothetical protein
MYEYHEIEYDCHDENGENICGQKVGMSFYADLFTCDDCGERFTGEYRNEFSSYDESRDVRVCESCADELCYCESCDTSMHPDHANYDRYDSPHCNNCWDNRERVIHQYDYMPDNLLFWKWNKSDKFARTFYPNNSPDDTKRVNRVYYGTEIEVEMGNNADRNELAEDIVGEERFLYAKSDGSLSNGFEIVTHPMTFEAFCNFDWKERVLKYRGDIRGYHPETTGIHIHISKSAFTDNHLLKFMSMIYEYKSFTHLIAQRPFTSSYNRWAKFKSGTLQSVKHRMALSVKNKKGTSNRKTTTLRWGEKYSPVNITKRNTVEVRVFKSNLEEVSFRKNLEYCDALFYFTMERPPYKLKLIDFIAYIRDNVKRYPNLNSFLASREESLSKVLEFPLAIPEGMEID